MISMIKRLLRRIWGGGEQFDNEKDYRLKNGMKIGNNVNIYSWSTIDAGKPWLITIGDNVIVSAGSVVSHDLKESGVYVGTPAKYICSIEDYRNKYQKLKAERPNFDKMRRWDDWRNSTEEEQEYMAKELKDGIGFFLEMKG